MLGMQDLDFVNIKGANGYQDRLQYDSVNIHYNGREDMGVWCELTGQGCRVFETLGHGDYNRLFKELLYESRKDIHITRIDVAFDDHDGLLDIKRMYWDTYNKNFVSKFARTRLEYDMNERTGIDGISIYHGRKGSDLMVRIYDKAAERGITDGSHWIRVELQMRDERAEAFARNYVDVGTVGVSGVFMGVLINYLRYVEPEGGDSNRWRAPMTDYWERFVAHAERIMLFERPGTDYNISDLENFVVRQAGNAIQTYIDIYGEEQFLQDIKKRGTKPNPKYRQMKERYARKEKVKRDEEQPEVREDE
jgi:phage replication initiation protein